MSDTNNPDSIDPKALGKKIFEGGFQKIPEAKPHTEEEIRRDELNQELLGLYEQIEQQDVGLLLKAQLMIELQMGEIVNWGDADEPSSLKPTGDGLMASRLKSLTDSYQNLCVGAAARRGSIQKKEAYIPEKLVRGNG